VPSVFSNPLGDIRIEDVEAFLGQKEPEGLRVEYKQDFPESKNLAKSVAAMANAEGDFLADRASVAGKITLDNSPLGGTAIQVDLYAGTLTSGKCIYDATGKTFSVTTSMTPAAPGNAFNLVWTYLNVPTNSFTWEFAPSA